MGFIRLIRNISKGYLFYIVLILFIPIITVKAQDDDNLKGALIIDKKAKIELKEANRNFEKINNVQPLETSKVSLVYNDNADVELLLPKLDTKVKVVTMKASDLTKLYGNYVKVGFGNYTSPYAEAFLHNKRSEKYSYGAHLKHFSSKNGPVQNSGTSENFGELYGTSIGKNTIIKGAAGIQRFRYNYYGYNQIASPIASEDTLKHIYNTLTFSVALENKNKKDKVNYTTSLRFYNFDTYRNAWENELLWNGVAAYTLDQDKKINVDAMYSFSSLSDSTILERSLFTLKPSYHWQVSEKLNVKIGVNLAYVNDTIGGSNNFPIYPNAKVEYRLIDNKVIVFGGIEGDMQKNTLRTLTNENTFLGSKVPVLHTNKLMDFYGGVQGGLKGGFNYKLRLSSASYQYMYFFNNSIADTSRFTVLYDTNPVTVLNIGAELGYEVSSSFRLAFATAYYHYNTSTVEKAWHRPDYTGSILATYNLNKKVYFNADFYYIGGLRGKNYVSGRDIYLKEIADLNLKVDYLFSKSFSAFVEVNNIFAQKYQRYLYYNNKGINVLAGLTYSF